MSGFASLLAAWRRPRPPMSAAAPDLPSLRSAALSHVGRVRLVNEDRVLNRADRGLWAVADGMGGHAAGDVAAEAVVNALNALARSPASFGARAIEAALGDVNRALHAGGSGRMSGSTVVVVHCTGARATLLWAGDSRAYRLRDGTLERLTRDHSLVQELVDAGTLDPALAEDHPQAHVVTRALGAAAELDLERREIDVREGDLLLLCSDGLARGASDPPLADHAADGLEAQAEALLAGALALGGSDNISLVLIRIGGAR